MTSNKNGYLYTGYKDRNGKDICFGDLVQIYDGHCDQGFWEIDEQLRVAKDNLEFIIDSYVVYVINDQGREDND